MLREANLKSQVFTSQRSSPLGYRARGLWSYDRCLLTRAAEQSPRGPEHYPAGDEAHHDDRTACAKSEVGIEQLIRRVQQGSLMKLGSCRSKMLYNRPRDNAASR